MCMNLRAFPSKTAATASLDPSTPCSKIFPSMVHALGLPCFFFFRRIGQQTYSAALCVPTINDYYRSRLNLIIGTVLAGMHLILGDDLVAPCQPVHSATQLRPILLDGLLVPRMRYPIAGSPSVSALPPFRSHSPTHTHLSTSRSIPKPSRLYCSSAGCAIILFG